MPVATTIVIGGRAFDISRRAVVVGVVGTDAEVAGARAAEGADLLEVSELLIDRVEQLAAASGLPVIVAVSTTDLARAAVRAGAAALRAVDDDVVAPDWAKDQGVAAITSASHPLAMAADAVVLGSTDDLGSVAPLVRRGLVVGLDDGTADRAPAVDLDDRERGRLVGLHVAAAVVGVRVVRTAEVRTVRRALDVLAAVRSARRARLGS